VLKTLLLPMALGFITDVSFLLGGGGGWRCTVVTKSKLYSSHFLQCLSNITVSILFEGRREPHSAACLVGRQRGFKLMEC
jgi:hypothetical protein